MKKLTTLSIAIALTLNLCAQTPTFVAHRGASYLAPENTLESIELAWELGAKAAECDIMLTADKKVIVFHDKKGERLTGKDFVMKESKYSDIKDLTINLRETNLEKYKNTATIPLLSDLLKTIPEDRTLVIEIKTGTEILPYMQKVISENWKSGNIAFIAFDYETILATKDMYPEIPCYYLSMFKFDINRKYKSIKKSKLDGVNLRHKIINEKLMKKMKAIDKSVWCWTVNEPADAQRMESLGVTGITTDRPKWLKENYK